MSSYFIDSFSSFACSFCFFIFCSTSSFTFRISFSLYRFSAYYSSFNLCISSALSASFYSCSYRNFFVSAAASACKFLNFSSCSFLSCSLSACAAIFWAYNLYSCCFCNLFFSFAADSYCIFNFLSASFLLSSSS